MNENKLNITDKEIQSIGLKLVEASPTAEMVDIYVYKNNVYIHASFADGTNRNADVPLLKEVDG